MSTIAHHWHTEPPPAVDVYTTRRNGSKYLTLRYWNGDRWFSLDYGDRRGAKPFVWPKNSRTRKTWVHRKYKDSMCLRNISASQATAIEWGEPYKVYDEKEVLAFLIETGKLRSDWKTAYQDPMRHFYAAIKGFGL